MKRTSYLVVAVLAVALFLMGASGQAVAQGADDPAQLDAGKTVFEASCAGCHAADGTGVAGLGRPLTGIAGQGDRATHVESVTNGKGNMPAFEERLSAEEIDQAISYVRLTFVAADTVADDSGAAAESASPATELALTGLNSSGLAALGAALVMGGAGLIRVSRRQRQSQ